MQKRQIDPQCLKAMEDLIPYRKKVISAAIYGAWVEKYTYLGKRPPNFMNAFIHDFGFQSHYSMFEELHGFYKCNGRALKAVQDWLKIDQTNEEQVWKWTRKHRKLINELIVFDYTLIDFRNPKNNDYFIRMDWMINTKELIPCIAFRKILYQYL